jgi:hypothetical protein
MASRVFFPPWLRQYLAVVVKGTGDTSYRSVNDY